ncbi:hypothetical protein [Anaeromyxobacter oryzae]|uniref:Porin n=1 Tax=Anaeromyxobacter oryzae TaxID=2918170 RepID=A0ABN6MUS0_9BACT|nr:hypothetical protein [Anaeromyxobacter oryzae]BDG03554.1 hypothetical protein AMOR_25500 [Anaeromyxobacter oryzae]
MNRRLAALCLALPLAAAAQNTPPPAAPEPAPAAATPPSGVATPPAPAAPPAPPAPPAPAAEPGQGAQPPPVAPEKPQKPAVATPPPKEGVTVEWSGWLQTHAWRTFGGVNPTATGTTDLPLFAVSGRDAAGVSARQSRIRAALGLPTDGLLAGAKAKGLVEMDFMGPLASDDHSLPAVRLRHAWVAATWKDLSNLTLTVGQTWGIFTGPHFAASLAHLAVPRFAGAGFLFRRAPQVRLSAETSGPVVLSAQVAALAPYDKPRSAGVLVGERSGIPDAEGRVALAVKPGGKPLLEVGASGRYGREVYFLDGAGRDSTIDSWGASVDARLDVPYLTVVGAAFLGEALGVYSSIAPEVKITTDASGKSTAVSPVRTEGFWAQAIVTPLPIVQLVGGYGIEEPREADLPTTATVINRNQQVSGGVILSLSSRWRVSTEVTWYVTNTQDRFRRDSTQVELGSLFAF